MRKLSLFLALGALALSMLIAGCGGGGDSLLSGSAISGGASKAPIAQGRVFVDGVYKTTTSDTGNFSLSGVNFNGQDRVEVQIRGGSTPFQTYPDDQVVLEGYYYKGDSNVYLSAFSMLEKRWIDQGLSREEAQSRSSALFNTVSALVGMNFGNVNVKSNPAQSDAFEVAQQALLSFLGVSESSSQDIGTDLGNAIDNNLTDATDTSSFNTDLGNFANDIIANRENILNTATTARGRTTALTVDTDQIKTAAISVNAWHSTDGGTLTQDGTIYLDLADATGTQQLDFFFNRGTDGSAGGGGIIEIVSDGTSRTNNTANVFASRLPNVPSGDFYVGGSVTALNAGSTNVNNTYARLEFDPTALTECAKRNMLDDVYSVRFYVGSNSNLTVTFKVRFTYSTIMSQVDSINTAAFGDATWTRDSTFNFGASDRALYIDKNSRVDIGAGTDLTANIEYSGADNLDAVFLRFLAPSGFRFNRSGWSRFYNNIDVYDLTAGGSPQTVTATTGAQVEGTGNFYLVAYGDDQPVGKKTFKAQVIDKETGAVLAVNGSDDDPIYFTTTDSLKKIADITLSQYGGDATPTYTELGSRTVGPDLAAFTGTIKTWGTLSGQDADCTGVDEVTDSTWQLSVWSFNEDDVSGFMYGAAASNTASDWAQNLDVVHDGAGVDGVTATGLVVDNCNLSIDPGANSIFKAYYHAGRFNVDKISVIYEYEPADSTENYSKASNTLDFEQ